MKTPVVTEIIQFQLLPEINEEEFFQQAAAVEENFHMQLEGYIDSELFKSQERQWGFVMHWESMETFEAASKQMMIAPETELFREMLDPKSVKLTLLEQVQTWKR
jgi:hypothetical protein